MKITQQWLFETARTEAEKCFNPETLICLIPRETAWYAITLLESGDPGDLRLANRILENITFTDGTHSPCTVFVMLKRYSHLLSAAAKQNLTKNLRDNLPFSAQVMYTDGNVNHPLAAFVNLICSGELFEQQPYVEMGKRWLIRFQQTISSRRHKFHQQAEMSEYNSPTYTALTLWFLAIAAEFARDSESRDIALFLEQCLWIDVAMHWHQPSQQFAGPFSRAYSEDSLGGFSALHCTFGYATGRDIFLDPELPARYAHPSALIENSFPAILEFHVPPQAISIAFEKPLPYYFRKTTYCEQYHENARLQQDEQTISTFDDEVYPGGWGDLTTYLTAEYCLGTASRPYVNAGHCDAFSLRYRRSVNIQNTGDFRGVYTRMVFNGAMVGQDNFCHITNSPINKDHLPEEGRAFTCQHKNKAIVCYSPKRAGHSAVTDIRLDIIFSYHAPVERIYVDGNPVKDFPAAFQRIQQIVIEDYNTYMAFFPLPQTLLADFKGLNRIWIDNDHLMISFYNYQGQSVDFTREQMSLTINGFACIVESRDKFKDLKHFREYLTNVSLTTSGSASPVRTVTFNLGEDCMSFKVDPVGERIIECTRNGEHLSVYNLEIDANGTQSGIYCPATLFGRLE